MPIKTTNTKIFPGYVSTRLTELGFHMLLLISSSLVHVSPAIVVILKNNSNNNICVLHLLHFAIVVAGCESSIG